MKTNAVRYGWLLFMLCLALVRLDAIPYYEWSKDFEIYYDWNGGDAVDTDMYLIDKATKQKSFFVRVPDLYGGRGNIQYHNGKLYAVRLRSGRNELWRYTKNGKGEKIYSSDRKPGSLAYSVSDDEKYIALNDHYSDELSFMSVDKKIFKKLRLGELGSKSIEQNPDLARIKEVFHWDKHERRNNFSLGRSRFGNRNFWGFIDETAHQGDDPVLFMIGLDDPRIAAFDLQPLYEKGLTLNDSDLNATAGALAISDCRISQIEEPSKEEWNKIRNKEYTLYVYEPLTKRLTKAAVMKGKEFDPHWIDENTLEFNAPSGNERTRKKLFSGK